MVSKICDQKGILLEGDPISIKVIWNRIEKEGIAFIRPFSGTEDIALPLYLDQPTKDYIKARDYLDEELHNPAYLKV